jgi:hypothetical protein
METTAYLKIDARVNLTLFRNGVSIYLQLKTEIITALIIATIKIYLDGSPIDFTRKKANIG